MEGTTLGNNGNGAADREKAMETILKCMRLAADPGATEGERDVAQRKAEQVMAKWQISSLEMRFKSESGKPKSTDQVKDNTEGFFDAKADWEWKLASGIAKTFNSRIIIIRGSGIQFFGHAQDLEIIDYFFSKLRLEIDSWAEDAYPRKSDIGMRRSYGLGMTMRVTERLKEMYEFVRNQMTNDCKDLVLISDALIQQRMHELYPRTKPMQMRSVSDHAYARGYMDGSSLNLESNRSRLQ
jgi:hypothetical protein